MLFRSCDPMDYFLLDAGNPLDYYSLIRPVESSMFKAGDKVWWGGGKAEVLRVTKNGVWITYWGQGLKEGKRIKQRVSRDYLTPRSDAKHAPC
jgi:hypothetical protein